MIYYPVPRKLIVDRKEVGGHRRVLRDLHLPTTDPALRIRGKARKEGRRDLAQFLVLLGVDNVRRGALRSRPQPFEESRLVAHVEGAPGIEGDLSAQLQHVYEAPAHQHVLDLQGTLAAHQINGTSASCQDEGDINDHPSNFAFQDLPLSINFGKLEVTVKHFLSFVQGT